MRTGPHRTIATTATALALLSGCAELHNPLTARRSTQGTLRTSVAQLQHENEQLKREVADLQVDNRRVADKLDDAEQANGELAAKLDDARTALKGEGGSILADTSPPASSPRRRGDRVTAPAGRSSRTPRRPPFARIPNRIEDAPADEPADDPTAPIRTREDLGPQSRLDGPARWLPVGPSEKAIR